MAVKLLKVVMREGSQPRPSLWGGVLFALALALAACSGTQTTGSGTDDLAGTEAGQTEVKEDAKQHFEEAVKLYEATKKGGAVPYAKIEGLLRDAIASQGNFSRAWYNLGVLAQEQGRDDEALEHYEKAFEADGTNGSPLVNMGMIAWKRGDQEKAFNLFVKAAEAEKFNPDARNNLAVIYRSQGNFPKAVENVRRALAGDSQSLAAYNSLARIYYALEKYDLARLVCFNALQLAENAEPRLAAPIHNTLGLILLKLNNVTVALKEFNAAVGIDPDFAEAHMNIGAISLSIRDYDRAIENFQKVSELRGGKDTEALLSLAVAKRGKGDLDAALAGYNHVLELDPKNSWAHFNIAVLNHEIFAQEAENPEKAIEHYNTAIENYREFLRLDTKTPASLRQDTDKRISNCNQLIKTQHQLKGMLKEQADMERLQAEQDKAAAEEERREAEEKAKKDKAAGDEKAPK